MRPSNATVFFNGGTPLWRLGELLQQFLAIVFNCSVIPIAVFVFWLTAAPRQSIAVREPVY